MRLVGEATSLPGRTCCSSDAWEEQAGKSSVEAALLLCLLYAVGILLVDLATHQDLYGTAVELVEHLAEDAERLEFVDQ